MQQLALGGLGDEQSRGKGIITLIWPERTSFSISLMASRLLCLFTDVHLFCCSNNHLATIHRTIEVAHTTGYANILERFRAHMKESSDGFMALLRT